MKTLSRKQHVNDDHLSGIEHPVIRQMLASRGIKSTDETNYRLNNLLDYKLLLGATEAAKLLAEAINANDKIVILGDYDADGCTATSVMVRGLRMCGSDNHSFVVPDRMKHGYGLSVEIIEDEILPLKANLLITVDSGISNIEGVAFAKKHGLTVIVTDHHLCADRLPDADVIVNPQQPLCGFPSKNLAGVGVSWYIMAALANIMVEKGVFSTDTKPRLAELLDIVALGTVADLVKLDKNNRILVKAGLSRIQQGIACKGINALIAVAGKKLTSTTETDLGFAIGPRINAAGRLANMRVGIECLTTDDNEVASRIANELDTTNRERRTIQQEIQEEANQIIEDTKRKTGELPKSIILYGPNWHEGVIGIIAGQVKESLYRPTIVFTDGKNDMVKGSGRSIGPLHLRDVLDELNKSSPGLISKFGGHHLAAGLSLPKERFDEFKCAFENTVDKLLSPDDLKQVIKSDGPISSTDLTVNFSRTISSFGPFGQGFDKPLFDDVFTISDVKILKDLHLKLTVKTLDGRVSIDSITFNVKNIMDDWSTNDIGTNVKMGYELQINEWQPASRSTPIIKPQLMASYIEKVN